MAEYDIASLFKRLLSASGVLRDDQGQQSEERQLFKLTLNQLQIRKIGKQKVFLFQKKRSFM